MERIWLMITFTAESTTAQLACCRRGVTRSTTPLASASSRATYEASESRMNTCPHSVHSLSAASSLYTLFALSWKMRFGSPADASLISVSAATALATTIGLASASSSRSWSTNPRSSTSSGLMSCSFATQIAAVFRTYGSSSVSVRCSGSHRYSVIFSTRMHPIVRTARARIGRIGVRGILHERVHGEDGELGLAPRVVEQVQVHQLLQLHVVGLRAVHHVGEEHGHVLADAHVGDDPLNRVLLHILVRGVDLLALSRHLAPLVRREELGVASRHLDFARPARAAQQSTARERAEGRVPDEARRVDLSSLTGRTAFSVFCP